ncbi:MAG: glycosyltransferase [Snowella sp.]|nr:glycosyltransferase [Snowella sp.]
MSEKIFILEPRLNGHCGNFTRLLSQAFSQKNKEVSIATYENEFNHFFIQNNIEREKIKDIYFLKNLMPKLNFLNVPSLIKKISFFPYIIEKFIFLLYIIIRFRPTIIMLPSIDGLIYLGSFFKPLIWILGNKTKVYGFLASYKIFYTKTSFLRQKIFYISLFSFDRVLINDEFFASHLKFSGFSNIQYMPDPIEDFCLNPNTKQLKLKWNLPINSYIVGMTGVIDYRKGSDIIIRATSEIKRDDITFVLAGKISNEIKDLLGTHHISTNLIVIDRFLSLQEMHEIITCFDLVLLPYRNIHFGIASMLLRAMSCNTPALVSKYGWFEKMSEKLDSVYSFEGEQDFVHQIQNIENIILNNHKDFASHYTEQSIKDFIDSWS